VAGEHSRRHGASVGFVYGHALKGYSATIPSERVAALRADSRVDYVVPDGVASAVAQTLPWGIDRINADASFTLAGNGSGAVTNVNAYVIDSGIAAHPDLNLVRHVNFASGKNTDCNGHGTHVAGTIAARDDASDVVGVAPSAPLTGVKVLGCNGSGTWSGVIKGIDWVTANATKPAVANMSLGGGANQAVDDAVRTSAASGVFYALAAGNEAANACNSSPARAGTTAGIVTTAATDSLEREASWSNFGPCVDIWSPGVSILSTRRGGGTTTMSGTSMASPHSAGGGALYLASHIGASASTVESALKTSAVSTGTLSKTGRAIKRLDVGGF
jgi:subtilisin family serine protease